MGMFIRGFVPWVAFLSKVGLGAYIGFQGDRYNLYPMMPLDLGYSDTLKRLRSTTKLLVQPLQTKTPRNIPAR